MSELQDPFNPDYLREKAAIIEKYEIVDRESAARSHAIETREKKILERRLEGLPQNRHGKNQKTEIEQQYEEALRREFHRKRDERDRLMDAELKELKDLIKKYKELEPPAYSQRERDSMSSRRSSRYFQDDDEFDGPSRRRPSGSLQDEDEFDGPSRRPTLPVYTETWDDRERLPRYR